MKYLFGIVLFIVFSFNVYAQEYQFLDATGKAITQEKFSDFYSSQTNYVIVKKGDLFGIFDTK